MKRAVIFPVFCLILLSYCTTKTDRAVSGGEALPDSIAIEAAEVIELSVLLMEKRFYAA